MERRPNRKAVFKPRAPLPATPICICTDHTTDDVLHCRECKKFWQGRMRIYCYVHPRKISLMDHVCCVVKSCRSLDIVQVVSFDHVKELIKHWHN